MKPLKLEFEGIRSFSERAEIDFEPLTASGLFGIFGATGSGKSTILDAIIIALYGGLSGMNIAEIVSARRQKAYVCFDFSLSERGERKKYRVERTFTVKNGVYKNSTAFLYDITGGGCVSLAEKTNEVNAKIESIIGLGQSEFTKCIILPQGEFATFVKATKVERVKIIEKLFDLEKYGERFAIKLRAKLSALENEKAGVLGSLSTYDDVTEEVVNVAKSELENCKKECDALDVKLLKIKEYIEENQKFFTVNYQLEESKKSYGKLIERREEIEKKKEAVSIYEKATAVNGVYCEYVLAKKNLDGIESDLQRLKDEEKDEKDKFESCKTEYSSLDELEKELNELAEKKETLSASKGDVDRVNRLNDAIKKCSAKINTVNADIENCKNRIDGINSAIKERTVKLEELSLKTDESEAFAFATKNALREEYKNQVSYYVEQIEKVKEFEDGSPLYAYVSDEFAKRKEIYTEKVDANLSEGEESGEEVVENYRKLTDRKKEIQSELSKAEVDLASEQGNLKSLQTLVEINSDELGKAKEERQTLLIKLSKIIDNIDDFDKELTTVSQVVKNVSERRDGIRKNYATALEALNETTKKLVNLNAEYGAKEKSYTDAKIRYEKLASETGIDGKKAQEVLKTGENAEEMKFDVERYEKDLEFFKTTVEKYETQLLNSGFSLETFEEKQKEQKEFNAIRENLIKNLGKYQNNVKNLSQKFKERCIIEKDLNDLTARMGVYERLNEAIARKAFSEFIASEFLSDVAAEARKTLVELTGGKYDVVYRDSTNGKDGFFVRDNLNGGLERSVSSLSGGETFLVSLSLALALSVNIYASSDKPMEFFFLDEGFGTLDDELIDVVLDSLERLKNKNFTIGLISHLAEMKSRIDSKITVTPASETKGSTVKQSE